MTNDAGKVVLTTLQLGLAHRLAMPHLRISPPPVALTLAAAAVFYAMFWPIVMDDVAQAYVPWLRHIVEAGPLHAFATPFADYNTPYLYLLALVSPLYGALPGPTVVKLVSLGGTVWLAVATGRLLLTLHVARAWRWAALIGLLPSTILNAALLGQCDALYAAPCIAALEAGVARRHRRMLLWCGIAIAFKIQAVLFAPFAIALLIRRRVPVRYWFVVPAVFVASLVPAWTLGWPASGLLAIYYRQTGYSPLLSLNAPNIWFVVQTLIPEQAITLSGLALACAVGATAAYITYFSVRLPERERMLPVAVLAVLVSCGLLPHMHERYFFVADIAVFAWAAATRDRSAWVSALLVQAGSTCAVMAYVLCNPVLVVLGFGCMAAATWRIAVPLLRPAADNPVTTPAT